MIMHKNDISLSRKRYSVTSMFHSPWTIAGEEDLDVQGQGLARIFKYGTLTSRVSILFQW
jgi:hypothetical protein